MTPTITSCFSFASPSRAIFVLLFVAFSPVSQAQSVPTPVPSSRDPADLTIDELFEARVEKVYSASKYEQKVTQAPASVTIVSRNDIEKFGYRNLADVLRGARGIYVTYERNYSNLGLRGFGRPGDFNTRVLLLVDGHRMNDNLYDSALVGTEAILDVDLIERVEIIRGPSSSIYGNSAFFGAFNVVTRSAADIDGVEVSAEGGSFETFKERITFGRKLKNGLELVLSGTRFDTEGQKRLYFPEFDTPANNHGVAEDSDAEQAGQFFGSLRYHEWTFSIAHSRREKQVPTASFGTVFNDGREKTTDRRTYADLKYQHTFTKGAELLGRLYYDHYGYRANYPYDFAGPGGPPFLVLTHDDHAGEGAGAELQVTHLLRGRHTLVWGGEYRRDLRLFQSSFTEDPRTYSFLDDRQGWSSGLYTQGEFLLRDDFRLNAGLRYDHHNSFGGTLNPRLGLIYNLKADTTLKLLYGRAYRAPNAYELFLESPYFSKANPGLSPEIINTYEVVYERYLPKNLRLSVSGYHFEVKDLLSQEFDPADGLFVFQNIGKVTGQGAEIELEGEYDRGRIVRVSYALQRAEDRRMGQEPNNSPRHLVKANLVLPLHGDALHAGFELQYTSSLKTIAARRTPAFLIANATLFSRKLAQGLDASVSIYNLFDKDYSYPGSTGHRQDAIPQDGRSFRIKLAYGF